MDAVTTTRMLQLATVMQQLPAGLGDVSVQQLQQAREALQAIESQPGGTPAPLLVTEPQQVDVYA